MEVGGMEKQAHGRKGEIVMIPGGVLIPGGVPGGVLVPGGVVHFVY